MQITDTHILHFLKRAATTIREHRDELTQLDSPIGDADHGINLDRGFTAVLQKLPEFAGQDVGTILKTTGMTLISTVGGTSGPLYGTAFMRAAAALTNRGDHIAEPEIVLALDAALEGIQARGKATRNEKTMVDALAPMLDLLHETAASDEPFLHRFRRAVAAAEEGMRATVPMLAKKGRASYLGERSIGHQDPGATSSFYLVRAMLETLEEVEA